MVVEVVVMMVAVVIVVVVVVVSAVIVVCTRGCRTRWCCAYGLPHVDRLNMNRQISRNALFISSRVSRKQQEQRLRIRHNNMKIYWIALKLVGRHLISVFWSIHGARNEKLL